MSVIEHQTVKLISGSTKLEYNKPIDADALIEIKGFRDIHHKDIAKLVDASPDLLEACKAVLHCNDYAEGKISTEFNDVLDKVSEAIAKADPEACYKLKKAGAK